MPPEEDEPMEMKVRREEAASNTEKSEGARVGRDRPPVTYFQVNARDHAPQPAKKPSTGSPAPKKPDEKK